MVNQKNVFCHLFPFYSPVKILPISKFCSEPFVSTPSTSEFCLFWTQAQWWVPSDTPLSNFCTMIKNWTKGQWEEHFLFISFCAGTWGVTICLYNLLAPKAYKGWLFSVSRFIQLICIIFYAKKKARKYKVKMAVIDHWHWQAVGISCGSSWWKHREQNSLLFARQRSRGGFPHPTEFWGRGRVL